MKTCIRCKLEKPLDSFSNNKNKFDGKTPYCRSCKSNFDKNYSKKENVKEKKKYSNKMWVEKRKISIKFWKIEKGGSCKKCGERRLQCLDFHHLIPSKKDIEVSYLISSYSIDHPHIKEEIDKCILLCKNCHSDFHYLEKKGDLTIEEYLIIKESSD